VNKAIGIATNVNGATGGNAKTIGDSNNGASIKITLDRKLSELGKAIFLALDDVAKENDEYRGDNKTLNEYRSWIKRTSTHCFGLDDLSKRLASETLGAALTIDKLKNVVLDMMTLSINKTFKRGKDDYDCLYKIFDSISVDKNHDNSKGYFSFGKTFESFLKRSKTKSFGQMIVSLKHTNDRMY
jgi:hypothetical protein